MTEIRIFGDRGSGKTTYLASLLNTYKKENTNPMLSKFKSKISIYPRSEETADWYEKAENVLKQGLALPPTRVKHGGEKYYNFTIEGLTKIPIDLTTKDLPGEPFYMAVDSQKWGNPTAYIDDLCRADGWLIMLTDWDEINGDYKNKDEELYKPALKKFLSEVLYRQNMGQLKNLRIAIVMNKCERGELWCGRFEAEDDLFKVRLPATYKILTNETYEANENSGINEIARFYQNNNLKFFACSSFGVMGKNDPRPNRTIPKHGSSDAARLKDSEKWQPFGLIEPIYWLSTKSDLQNTESSEFISPRDLGRTEVRIIGPCASGKTTLISTLADYPNFNPSSPLLSVEPRGVSINLKRNVTHIIKQGKELEPTRFLALTEIRLHQYSIIVNSPSSGEVIHKKPENTKPNKQFITSKVQNLIGRFFNRKLPSKLSMTMERERFQIFLQEYSGGFLESLQNGNNPEKVEEYLDDCAEARGLLLLIDSTSSHLDWQYANSFSLLQAQLMQRLEHDSEKLENYRIAVVFSKCEQPEIWSHRHNIPNFVSQHFPETKKIFDQWNISVPSIKYFFGSAFGKYGINPEYLEPNFRQRDGNNDGTYGVIKNPQWWQPIGLVAPLYWLTTGKDYSQLREIN